MVARVTRTGGLLVHGIFYSAPSRLIGQRLRVHVYDDRIEAWLGSTQVLSHPPPAGRLRQRAVKRRLAPRQRDLPADVPVALTTLAQFDALLEAQA